MEVIDINTYVLDYELYHHGVKGQKWGIRRFQKKDGRLTSAGKKRYDDRKRHEKAYRKQMNAIAKNKNADDYDRKLADYRKDNLAVRAGKTAGSLITQQLLRDVFTGDINRYSTMGKKEIRNRLTSLALATAGTVVFNDALAKSASKRYNSDGRTKAGKKHGLLGHKEQWIATGVQTVARAAPVLALLGGMKLSQVAAQKRHNEEVFNRWGGNILAEKVDNVVWQDADLKYAVIDNRGR